MILLLSTSDTDLLSARAANTATTATTPDGPATYRFANPSRLPLDDLPALLDGVDLVVVRLLGGLRAWQDGLDVLLAPGQTRPVVVLTGEQAPDAQLMEASTVPIGIAAEAHAYLAHGGPANLGQLARFLSDTVLLTGHGFEPPAPAPTWGHLDRTAETTTSAPTTDGPTTGAPSEAGRPTIAVLYYRAHQMSGNTAFVHALCEAIEARNATPLPLYVSSSAPRSRSSSKPWPPRTRSSPPSSPPAAPAPPPRPRAVTTSPGTPAPWPPSACRSSRPSA